MRGLIDTQTRNNVIYNNTIEGLIASEGLSEPLPVFCNQQFLCELMDRVQNWLHTVTFWLACSFTANQLSAVTQGLLVYNTLHLVRYPESGLI